MAEITQLIEKMYGHHYTSQTISNTIKAVLETVEAFNNRTLHNRYVCVCLDATYIAVCCDTVSKEVLGYTIAPTESAYNWQELLKELKD